MYKRQGLDGRVRRSITDGQKTWIWYDSERSVYETAAGDIDPDAEQRLPTYEEILARDKTSLDITWMKSDSGTEDYTLSELLDQIKEKSANIAKAVAALEELIGEVDE